MIKNFLIMDCIGNNDRLGLRINKDFFIYNFKIENNVNETLVKQVSSFLKKHNVKLDETFSIIVNQGPGSFSSTRISLAVAKGLKISKKISIYGYRNTDLKVFNQENVEKLINKKLIEKKLIKPIYLS